MNKKSRKKENEIIESLPRNVIKIAVAQNGVHPHPLDFVPIHIRSIPPQNGWLPLKPSHTGELSELLVQLTFSRILFHIDTPDMLTLALPSEWRHFAHISVQCPVVWCHFEPGFHLLHLVRWCGIICYRSLCGFGPFGNARKVVCGHLLLKRPSWNCILLLWYLSYLF